MNLPLVLDIAIGLVFSYLILSLLASEIQELMATLLQWRAEHLRKSIENLLSGGENTPEEEESVQKIVNDLYDNPLIRNINQESKEGIAGLFRQLTWGFGTAYRSLTSKKTTTFGQDDRQNSRAKYRRSAPSYIPSETFATTLLSRLNITTLTQKISLVNLLNFKQQEIFSEIEHNIEQINISEENRSGLKDELRKLEVNVDKILSSFKTNKATLLSSINRIGDELDKYIENSKYYFTEAEVNSQKQFVNNLTFLKKDLFNDPDELVGRLKPGLAEIADVLGKGHTAYGEVKSTIQDQDSEIFKAYQDIETEIKQVSKDFPKSARESLSTLAMRAQIKAERTEQELNQFKQEIEVWFDRSMERASGVYKRNAKGVAFLIGLLLAFAANADTFHIIGRLAKDTPLRNAITSNAGQAALDQSCSNFEDQDRSTPQSQGHVSSKLDCIRNGVSQTLNQVSLPLGRSSENLIQQKEEGRGWQLMGVSFSPLRKILGWIISGLAISMGAPFWFELLGKLMNVRNTGPKPASSTEDRSSN